MIRNKIEIEDSPNASPSPEEVKHVGREPTRVVHFSRRAFPGQHSIEKVFEQVRHSWSDDNFKIIPRTAPHLSLGVFNRIANCRWASQHQGEINHILGDIHYIALGLTPKRTILTICDCFTLTRLKGIKRQLYKRFWFDLPAKRVAAITVISEETKRELIRHVPVAKNKTYVIPCAVAPIFRPNPRAFRTTRTRILQVGVTPNKNLGRLFAALDGMDCELKIIGKLSDEDRSISKSFRVSISEACNLSDQEMYECYCDADIISFPSTYEGFGLPIIEGQWIERPVITSNCSSMPEVAGEGACLVDPMDVASIRTGFQRVINSPDYRNNLLKAGKRNRLRFSYPVVSNQYADLYEAVSSASSHD